VGRAATGTANARDLVAMRSSLQIIPQIAEAVVGCEVLSTIAGALDPLPELRELLETSIADDPPPGLRDGGLIRDGYHAELDELRRLGTEGKDWIARLEQQERERTGIKSLKVGFNQVFGYYLEVSRPNLSLVPADYIRKQTMVNAERFITPDLKEWEARVLGAQDRIITLEADLFAAVRQQVAAEAARIQATARAVAQLDVLAGLAQVAAENDYHRPAVDADDVLEVHGGRHPVVERASLGERFIPNDTTLDCRENQLLIITGPNMAGKSTYLRQVALLVVLAQMGSFVPAESARIGVVDRIFTRVGASDDLATGQSTFMVEMTETAQILHHATQRSLIVLDEVGRGTSTFDGLSIAWAVVEHLHNHPRLGAKTLFATHYHQLNELERSLPRVKNYRIAVKEEGDRIIFLRKIIPGGTDRSYGIQVARLAGLPQEVIERAKEVLWALEQEDQRGVLPAATESNPQTQFTLFEARANPVIDEIRGLDVTQLTPLDALNKLAEMQDKVKKQ
jgi:DNA mismatch repair protein MutS